MTMKTENGNTILQTTGKSVPVAEMLESALYIRSVTRGYANVGWLRLPLPASLGLSHWGTTLGDSLIIQEAGRWSLYLRNIIEAR